MGKKFNGALGESIFLQPPSLMLSEEEREAAERDLLDSIAAARSAKLWLLFDHYGISHGRFADLAMAMAVDLIPGFQVTTERKGPGPKRKWDPLAHGYLVVEINRQIKKNPRLSVKAAAAHLAKREPWKSYVRSDDPAERLRQEYDAAKDAMWAKVFSDAFRTHESSGTVSEWDEMILRHLA
ncbi:hypothetical protein [Burkholderia sp. Bp8986]|uniref:hypothetical protein n=1 Tax=Burkholderia sp. Bp8986 TaxID=2184550 RepID=UPI000F59A751|nr:hypothetical protein [Burkholderia sp. Bp8986]RQS43948.1 hypothetical protein DID99_34620 [Burkholderia sp. Bp8986]